MEQQQKQQQQQQQDADTESTISSILSKKEKCGIKRKLDVKKTDIRKSSIAKKSTSFMLYALGLKRYLSCELVLFL